MDISTALSTIFGSYAAAVAIIAVGIGMLIWKVSAAIKGINDKVDGIKDLPCREHTEQLNSHKEHFANTEKTLSSLEAKLDLLVRLMPQTSSRGVEPLFSDDVPRLSQKHSPKVLNENGKFVEKTFGCREFLSDNAEWLLSEVAKFNPKTALDVELYSLAALRIASLDDRFNSLKDKIYTSPAIALSAGEDGKKREVEISLEDVLFVISLPLRDLYLERHPEISVAK